MIEKFARLLSRIEEDLSDQSLADIFWLADFLPAPPPPASSPGADQGETTGDQPKVDRTGGLPEGRLPPFEPRPKRPRVPEGDVYPTVARTSAASTARATPIRIPATKALPNALEIARAMRPLARRCRSHREFIMDDEMTAERIAEGGSITPVMRPLDERWFAADVIVDGSRSMIIWHRVVREFLDVLAQLGAFADVRQWTLSLTGTNAILRSPSGLLRQPGEIKDPAARRLVFVLTDGVGDGWRSASVPNVLAAWGRTTPVVIVQMLPERLWPYTALGVPSANAWSPVPGMPNSAMVVKQTWWDEDGSSVAIPIVPITLEAPPIRRWAAALMGAGEIVPAILFPGNGTGEKPIAAPTTNLRDGSALPSAEERVQRFRAMVSHEAYELAVFLSAVPLTMPVIGLVQRELLPQTRQVHLAEVLVGGIVKKVTPDNVVCDADQVEFDFLEGVREVLLESLRRSEAVDVLLSVSRYVEKHFHQALDFGALIGEPKGVVALPEAVRPFAHIGMLTYERFHDHLESPLLSWTAAHRAPVSWLHVSDLHCQAGGSLDRDVVLHSLVQSVAKYRARGRRVDLVFATGDVAYSGKEAEYRVAAEFFDALLEAAGIEKRHLFVIPGNHDIDRGLGVGLVRTLSSREEADAYFLPSATKFHILLKQREFIRWYNSYFDGIRRFPESSTCGPVEAVEIGGNRVGILPVNSTLFCQDDTDYAKLWIGRQCLDAGIEELKRLGAGLNIALVHHPLDWLHDAERAYIRITLQSQADVILCGHMHGIDAVSVARQTGKALHMAAGSAYNTRMRPNRVLYATLEDRQIRVFPVHYEDERNIWTVDPSVFPSEPEYTMTVSISPLDTRLPELRPTDPGKPIVVPREFKEAVEKAERDGPNGRTTLALLAEEANRTRWAREGLRLVGGAQWRRKSFAAARETWEFIRRDLPEDAEANLALATIYHRLGDLVTASHACQRVLDNENADRRWRADARSQLARNEKACWVADHQNIPDMAARRQQAISDHRLIEAAEGYLGGFSEDLNDYYSGLNALGLLTVIVKLAELEPEAWAGTFATTRRATSALDDYREQLAQTRGAVGMSLENARRQVEKGKPDKWLPPSEAQYRLLTAENPVFVRNAYRTARDAGGGDFATDSEAAQVMIFHRLGLFPDNCREALAALGVAPVDVDGANGPIERKPRDRVIVATGHRADALGRPPPARFPNTPDCIAKAKAWLREAVRTEQAATAGTTYGIAGAASGVDLLFHEVCAELGIATRVVLPMPIEDYRRESVADGGGDWVEKFNRLVAANPPIVLGDRSELPPWVESIANYGVFQRGNIWVMEDALLRPDADVAVVAIWNGRAGNGPGGTADMVKLAESHGAKVVIGDPGHLFGLP